MQMFVVKSIVIQINSLGYGSINILERKQRVHVQILKNNTIKTP